MLSRSNYSLLLLFIIVVGTMIALTTSNYSFSSLSSSSPSSSSSSSPSTSSSSPSSFQEQNTIQQENKTKEETIIKPTISPLSNTKEFSKMLQFGLAQECESIKWTPGLYLHCDPIVMGAYNAINKLQVCIRWAIDAGAGLIRPNLTTRGVALTDLRGDLPQVSIEYLLDERFLWESLAINCPQMNVIELDTVKNNATFLPGVEVEYFIERFWKGEFGPKISAILTSNNVSASLLSPVVVTEKETLGAWIRSYDTFEFQIAYKNIFRISRMYVPYAEQILSKLPTLFFGVHLRLESDWTANRDDVMFVFLDKILQHNTSSFPIVYVASGDQDKLDQFTNLAANRQIIVVHKWKMLDQEGRDFLSGLGFDQMGMVDRLVLEKADYFYGVGGSSFSFSLGQHRHYEQTGDMEYYPRNDERQYLEGSEGDMWYGLLWG